MDAYIIYLLVVLAAGSFRTLVPYVLKVYSDPTVDFDIVYFYDMIIAMVLSVVVLIPDAVEVSAYVLIQLFLSALGMNELTVRAVDAGRRKRLPALPS